MRLSFHVSVLASSCGVLVMIEIDVSAFKNFKGIMCGFPEDSAKSFRIEIFLFIQKDSLADLPLDDLDLSNPLMLEKVKDFYTDKVDFQLEDILRQSAEKDDYLNIYFTDFDEDFEDYVDSLIPALDPINLVPMAYHTVLRGVRMSKKGQLLDVNGAVINVDAVLELNADFNEFHTAARMPETEELLSYLQKNYFNYSGS